MLAVPMQKIAILYDASQAVLSTFDLEQVLEQILHVVHNYFQVPTISVFLLDEITQELVLTRHVGPADANGAERIPLGAGVVGTAAAEQRPISCPAIGKEPADTPHFDIAWRLAIPLMVKDELLGVLACQTAAGERFDAESVDLLTLFSTQASLALHNARLHSLERSRARQLEAINTIAQQMTIVLDPEELLTKVCSLIGKAFDIDHVSVLLREDKDLVLRAHEGKLTPLIPQQGHIPAEEGPWNRILMGEKVLIENDLKQVGRFSGFFEQTSSRMSIALVSFGQTLGVLVLDSARQKAFDSGLQQTLESLADICATAIQNAQHVERVRQLAYLDGLTGIFNRRFFELRITEELERATRFESNLAVLMVDIDQFKRLNDEFGHLLGDEVLRQVSSIFSDHLRKIDVVCRYGGEEFAILLPETAWENALHVADKLKRVVEKWAFPGVPRPVTVSAGAATFPEHGRVRDELVKAADAGLYAAKQAGRNCVRLAPASSRGASAQ
jgi:diguanylate cyclase (GGDEF)-like protein